MSELTYWEALDPPMSFIPEGWTYEQKREFRYACIPYLLATVDFKCFAGKRVLCVGDGSGIDAIEFMRHGALVNVVDMSQKAIDLTKKHRREAFAVGYANCRNERTLFDFAEVADVSEKLNFESGTFDVVYAFGVIHHIPEVDKAVREIVRVLKPGGVFMGMVYNKNSLLYAYSILARGLREGLTPDKAMREYSERNPGCPHSVAYTHGELRAVLVGNGFCGVNTATKYDVIDLPGKRKVPFTIVGDASLGWHLFFEAIM